MTTLSYTQTVFGKRVLIQFSLTIKWKVKFDLSNKENLSQTLNPQEFVCLFFHSLVAHVEQSNYPTLKHHPVATEIQWHFGIQFL